MAAEAAAEPSGPSGGGRLALRLALPALVVGALLVVGGPAPDPARDATRAEAEVARDPAAADAAEPPRSDPAAETALARAQEALTALHWRGTQFVARWGEGRETSALVDVVHVPGRGSLVRPVTGTTASAALVPETSRVGGAAPGAARGSGAAAPLTLLERHYALQHAGEGRCAGRPAAVVAARRRNDPVGTLAARFWLDRETGLVLRREVFDTAGRTVLASAFLDLDTSRRPAAERGWPDGVPDEGLEPVPAAQLRAEGWPVPDRVAGLELHETRARGAGQERLVHLAYSDGLLSVSVFVQPGELDREALQGWQSQVVAGAEVWLAEDLPHRVAWAAEGNVLTVIADAPAATVHAAVTALPHDPGVPGSAVAALRARLARGLARVAGWVDPAHP